MNYSSVIVRVFGIAVPTPFPLCWSCPLRTSCKGECVWLGGAVQRSLWNLYIFGREDGEHSIVVCLVKPCLVAHHPWFHFYDSWGKMLKSINASPAQRPHAGHLRAEALRGQQQAAIKGPERWVSGMDVDILLCNNDLFFRRRDREESCLAIMWVLKNGLWRSRRLKWDKFSVFRQLADSG